MKTGNAIEVTNVTKKFKVYMDKGHTIKEKVLFRNRRKYEERVVLNNISFEIKKGEAVGFIGYNGCGKSTTLKLLSKIMYPDSGKIEMRGRVSSLIELGAGFHPDMSGRQNIYTNASIFGLTRKEIEKRIPDIIAFSELEEFIDNPVRTYSSGMYMRLAFSVAINVDADILLIDEILAVGDANFQDKCFNKLKEIKDKGVTIVIVSHSMSQIEQICDRSIWISDGNVKLDGTPKKIHSLYMDYMWRQRLKSINTNTEEGIVIQKREGGVEYWRGEKKIRWGNRKAEIIECNMQDLNGKQVQLIKTGEPVVIKTAYKLNEKVEDAVFGIGIFRLDGLHCYGTNTKLEQVPRFDLVEDGEFKLFLETMSLLPGEYTINVTLEMGAGIPVDFYTEAIRFVVYSDIQDIGVFRMKHRWEIKI